MLISTAVQELRVLLRIRERRLMDELMLSSQRVVSLRDDVQWGLKNIQGLRKNLDTAQEEVVRSRTRIDTLRDEVLSFNRVKKETVRQSRVIQDKKQFRGRGAQ